MAPKRKAVKSVEADSESGGAAATASTAPTEEVTGKRKRTKSAAAIAAEESKAAAKPKKAAVKRGKKAAAAAADAGDSATAASAADDSKDTKSESIEAAAAATAATATAADEAAPDPNVAPAAAAEADDEEAPNPNKKKEVVMTPAPPHSAPVSQLKLKLKEWGLSSSGSKQQIVTRYKYHLEKYGNKPLPSWAANERAWKKKESRGVKAASKSSDPITHRNFNPITRFYRFN